MKPDGFVRRRADPVRLQTEAAALEFLGDLGLDIVPRVLSADLDASVLLLEDLSPAVPLSEILLGPDRAAAQEGLRSFAAALGTLHAATAGYHEAWGRGAVDSHARLCRETVEIVVRVLGLDVAASGAERDLHTVLEQLEHPGPFLAFSNGDAAANNYLLHGGRGWLVDFELAHFRHVLLDAVALYVPGPAWVAVADPVSTGAEDAYRRAVARAVTEAEEDRRFDREVAAASIAYAIARLHRLPRLDARSAGHPSRAQMASTLEAAADVANGRGMFQALAGWLREVAARLRRRWPDADVPPPETPRYVLCA